MLHPYRTNFLKRVNEGRLELASELEPEPMMVRCGKLAGVTFAVCSVILAIVFFVQLVGGGR
jgi:hypothetical protein